jgi:hypothetical protein
VTRIAESCDVYGVRRAGERQREHDYHGGRAPPVWISVRLHWGNGELVFALRLAALSRDSKFTLPQLAEDASD